MKQLGYTSVNRILSKLVRDLGIDDFSETDVIEWTAEALEAIGAVTMLEESVAFIEVKNHTAELPSITDSIIQIARNNEWTAENKEVCSPKVITESICPTDDDCSDCCDLNLIPVDSFGNPLFDEDRYEYRPNINVQVEYINWASSDYFKQKWTPVRLKNHTFFNSLVCDEDNAEGLYDNSKDEYTIIGSPNGKKFIRLSFKEGFIAVAYNRQMLDESGYPMIPDHFSFVTAVTKYITLRLMERMYYQGRQGYGDKVAKADADWQWYCKQAGNEAMMPGLDMLQNMLEQRQYLIPRIHRYNQFFKDMSTRENRVFNDPDGRNQINRHGRGQY